MALSIPTLGIRGRGIAKFFENLLEGDAVAWGIVAALALIALALGLYVLKVKRDFRREDEARKRRRGY